MNSTPATHALTLIVAPWAFTPLFGIVTLLLRLAGYRWLNRAVVLTTRRNVRRLRQNLMTAFEMFSQRTCSSVSSGRAQACAASPRPGPTHETIYVRPHGSTDCRAGSDGSRPGLFFKPLPDVAWNPTYAAATVGRLPRSTGINARERDLTDWASINHTLVLGTTPHGG